jgi:hypothetical protein
MKLVLSEANCGALHVVSGITYGDGTIKFHRHESQIQIGPITSLVCANIKSSRSGSRSWIRYRDVTLVHLWETSGLMHT